MYQKLLSINWMYLVLVLLGVRSVINASLAQALVVACFAGIKIYKDYLDSKQQKDIDSELKKELSDMKAIVGGLAMKNAAKPAQMEQQVRRFF